MRPASRSPFVFRFLMIIALLTVLFGVLIPLTVAQDAPPADSPYGTIPTHGEASDALFTLLVGFVGASPLVSLLVQLLKRIEALDAIPAQILNIGVSLGVIVLAWITDAAGVRSYFDTGASLATAILTILLGTAGGSSLWYNTVKGGVPLLGTSRDELQSQRASPYGQGLVEYALILVLVAVVVIVVLALLGPTIGNIFSNILSYL